MIINKKKQDILKHQQGGSLPYATYTNVAVSPTPQGADIPKEEGAKKEDSGLLPKEVFKYLYENGLPSDISDFVSRMSSYANTDFSAMSSSDITQQQLMLLMEISKIGEGKRRLKDAQANAIKEGTIHSLAITNSGMFYIMGDDGKINMTNAIKPGDRALTNGDLIGLRSEIMPHANNISDTISNGVGFDSIQKKINSSIEKLGSELTSGENMYIAKQNQEVLKGIGLLMGDEKATQLGAQGQYKVGLEHETNQKSIARAMTYLYGSLSNVEKKYLDGMASINGLANGGMGMLQTILGSKAIDKEKTSLNYNKLDFNEDGTIRTSLQKEKDEKRTKMTPAVMHIMGKGAVNTKYNLSLGNTEYSTNALKWTTPSTAKNEPAQSISTVRDYFNDVLQSYYDPSQVYFGDSKVDESTLSEMAIGSTSLNRAMLPVKQDGSPNYDLIYSLNKAKEELNKEKNNRQREGRQPLSQEQQTEFIKSQPIMKPDSNGKAILSEDGGLIGHYVGDDLNPNPALMKEFFLVDGYIGRKERRLSDFYQAKGLSIDYDNPYITDLSDMKTKNKDIINDKFEKLNIDNRYDIKGGVIAVAIPEGMEEYAASSTGSNVTMPDDYLHYENIEKNRYSNMSRAVDNEKMKSFVKPDSSKLKQK